MKRVGINFKDGFTFIVPGYNVRPLEMSGAIGSVQLEEMAGDEKNKS